jgi:hypothetical protein
LYSRQARYSDQKARDVLGYRPRFDLRRGLALSVLWMTRNGYIHRPLHRLSEEFAAKDPRSVETVEQLEPAAVR